MKNGNKQDFADWPAPVPVTAQVNEFIPEICKVPYDYLFRDSGSAMAECTLLVREYTGLDAIRGNTDIYNFEAESAGAKINFYLGHMPDVDRNDFLIKSEQDLHKIKWSGLESGRFPYLIEYIKTYKELSGSETFPIFCSPFSLACNLYGLENLIVTAYTDPGFVHELLRRIVYDLSGPMIRDLSETLPGLKSIRCADAWGSPPVVNLDIIKAFVVPYIKLIPAAAGLDVPVTSGGYWGVSYLNGPDREEFMDIVTGIGSGATVYDPDLDLIGPGYFREYADKHGARLTLGLGTDFLQTAEIDDIVSRAKRYILVGKNGKTPFTFTIGNISPHTPVKNIMAVIAANEIYGAVDADENAPFIMPDIETFESFLRRKIQNNTEGYTFDWLNKSGQLGTYLMSEKK